ncbi:hypothetical protein COLO4_14334 [Corchorus olitorius]|uniref:Uncharacterized protein n=1 Tax=Corchorus olitorius TaxID=93759 RepID=A0A1R3JSQ8_9ROSI|nr:hypothetical protein COLO4_14334 [Corchorus olitorius]
MVKMRIMNMIEKDLKCYVMANYMQIAFDNIGFFLLTEFGECGIGVRVTPVVWHPNFCQFTGRLLLNIYGLTLGKQQHTLMTTLGVITVHPTVGPAVVQTRRWSREAKRCLAGLHLVIRNFSEIDSVVIFKPSDFRLVRRLAELIGLRPHLSLSHVLRHDHSQVNREALELGGMVEMERITLEVMDGPHYVH